MKFTAGAPTVPIMPDDVLEAFYYFLGSSGISDLTLL